MRNTGQFVQVEPQKNGSALGSSLHQFLTLNQILSLPGACVVIASISCRLHVNEPRGPPTSRVDGIVNGRRIRVSRRVTDPLDPKPNPRFFGGNENVQLPSCPLNGMHAKHVDPGLGYLEHLLEASPDYRLHGSFQNIEMRLENDRSRSIRS